MNQLQGTVLGIEAQTLLDSFLLILTGNTKYSHRGQYRPAHCKNIVFYSTWNSSIGDTNISFVCKPVDPDKYPDWVCYYRDPANQEISQNSTLDHGYCGRQNIPCSRVYWCVCKQGAANSGLSKEGTRAAEYFIASNVGDANCEGCINDHGNVVVCENCGQVHD